MYVRKMPGLGDVSKAAPLGLPVGATLQAADDASEGFMRHLAGTLAWPIDTVRNAVNQSLGDGKQDPNEVYNSLISTFDAYGITQSQRTDLNEFMENLGRDGLDALLLGGGLAGAAGKLTRAGAGKVSKFIGGMGQSIKAHPGATAITEVGASLTGTEGENVVEKYAPGYGAFGKLAGSLAGGGLTGLGAFRGTRGAREAMPNEPLFSKNANPEAVPGMATASVDTQVGLIDGDINTLMDDVLRRTRSGTSDPSRVNNLMEPVTSARVFMGHAREAARRASVMEDERWVAAVVGRPAPFLAVQRLRDIATRIRSETEGASTLAPQKLLRMIDALPDEADLGQLIGAGSVRSVALAIKRAGWGKVEGGGTVGEYADEIQTEIMNTIEQSFPGDAAIAEANRFSRWKNDYFYRKNSHLRPFVTGTDVAKDADNLMANLMSRSGGGEAVNEVSQGVLYQELYTSAQQQVRDEFRARVYQFSQTRDPVAARAAADWLNSPEVRRFIQYAPREGADLEHAANNLRDLYATRDAAAETAFGRLAGKDIKSSIAETLNMADRAAPAVRDVMANLRASGDVFATQGYQSGMVNAIWSKAGQNVDTFERMLTQKGYKEIFDVLLSPAERKALQGIVADMKRVQAGDVGKIRKAVRTPVTFFNQWIGSKGASALNPGSIQFSGKSVGFMTRLSERIFATLGSGDDIFGRAVVDPHFRKLLHSSIPSNRRDAVAMFRYMTTMLSVATAGTDKEKLRAQIGEIPAEIRKSIPKILLNAGERDRYVGSQ